MEEIWKDVYFEENGVVWDYRGKYQVSNLGNVKSLKGTRGGDREKILRPRKSECGYLDVILSKNGKTKSFKVHRLVGYLFLLDTHFDGAEINHIDENKENNIVENLEWCSRKENCNHGTRNKRRKKKVIGYSLETTKVVVLQSATQGKKLGFNQGNISGCCNGKLKSAYGFIWKYLEED